MVLDTYKQENAVQATWHSLDEERYIMNITIGSKGVLSSEPKICKQ
jgi:hypothetical protein